MAQTDDIWDFFIAHATPDMAAAELLYTELTKHARVFLGSKCLDPGADWHRELRLAQTSARVTVALISWNTDDAYYLREEIATAIALTRDTEGRHRLVPVCLDSRGTHPLELPYGLLLKHVLRVGPEGDLSLVVKELLRSVHLENTATQPAGTPPAQTSYDTSSIRRLLTTALSDDSIAALCMDHFPSVYEQLSTGMQKNQKIQVLLEHCSRHRAVPKLLHLIEQLNPAAFAEYRRSDA